MTSAVAQLDIGSGLALHRLLVSVTSAVGLRDLVSFKVHNRGYKFTDRRALTWKRRTNRSHAN